MFLRRPRKHVFRSFLCTVTIAGCLFVTPQIFGAAPEQPGDPGTDGTAGAQQDLTLNFQADIDAVTNWGQDAATASTAGEVGGDGRSGSGSAMGVAAPAEAGTNAAIGGRGGAGGAGGALDVEFHIDIPNLTLPAVPVFGATGGAGSAGGDGGEGGYGGSGGVGNLPYTPYRDGAKAGNGGTGAVGGNGGKGSDVRFEIYDHSDAGEITISNVTFGGTGGLAGNGGAGGRGGNGGYGANGVKEQYPVVPQNHNGGNGADGGNGGLGGNGGTGGDGGAAALTLHGGTVNLTNVTMGGAGGNGGNGGAAGAFGLGGTAGAAGPFDGSVPGIAGNDGQVGTQGNGGNGGNGGIGMISIEGAIANFAGTTYFGGTRGTGGTGKINGQAGNDGTGNLQILSGTANLNGDLQFRGNYGTVDIQGGTLNFTDSRTINLGTNGVMSIAGGTTLGRSTTSGVLTINGAQLGGPVSGKIMLDVVGSGTTEFLRANTTNNFLSADSFDVSTYRQGTEVTLTGGVYSLVFGAGAMPLEWVAGGDGNWELGTGKGGANWHDGTTAVGVDFMSNDIANFKGQGQGNVNLVGAINPQSINITNGTYTFTGTGYLSNGALTVTSGANLTLANTGANAHASTTIGAGSSITAKQVDSLGAGTVTNAGTLNLDIAVTGELTNVLTGAGAINKTGAGVVTLTGDSSATGILTVTAGSIQIGNGGTSGSYAGNIESDTDVTFNRSDASTYAGALSGTGKLVKTGAGALTLTGANTNAGVEINAGSIVVGNVGALAGGADVNTNGTLDVNGMAPTSTITMKGGSLINSASNSATLNTVALNSNSKIGGNMTISNVMAGAVGFEKIGPTTLILTGDNTYSGTTTVSGGVLQIGDDSTTGSITSDVILNGTDTQLTFKRSDALTHANTFTGTGIVAQNGAGTLTLSADSSAFAGTFKQLQGGLHLDATAKLGGTFQQTGGALTSADGATLNNAVLGGSVTPTGALNILGNASFNGATIDIGTGRGTNVIHVTGTADITGSTINIDLTGVGPDEDFTLITSNGMSGTSTIVISNGGISRGGQYILDNDLKYQLFSGNATLTWNGSASASTWDTSATNTDWNKGTLHTSFVNGDTVIFDSTAANKNVTVAAAGVDVAAMTVSDNYQFSGGQIRVAGNVDVTTTGTLGLTIGTDPALTAATIDFNTTGKLNVTGYTPGGSGNSYNGEQNLQTLITTTGGIQNFNPEVTVANQASVDFLSARAFLDGNDVKVETLLTWQSTDPSRPAHGDFNVTGSPFTLGVTLTDNSASTNKRADWDGNSLTKLGGGTLILTADNTYTGVSTVNAGKLQLGNGGTTGNVAGNIDVKANATLAVNRDGDLTNNVSGAGAVEVLKDVTFTGTNTYTGGTNVASGVTLTGALPNGGDLNLAANAKYALGGADRTIGKLINTETSEVMLDGNALTIGQETELLGNISGTGNLNLNANFTIDPKARIKTSGTTTVGNGATLKVIGTQDATEAVFQGGSLTIGSGGTIETTFVDYNMKAGTETPIFVGNDMTGFTNSGSAITVSNRLYKIAQDLTYNNGQLYYLLKRNFSADLFPNISPQLAPVIDSYEGGNAFIENLMNSVDSDAVAEVAVQSGFDILNLAAPMSALYDTQVGINNTIYTRSQAPKGVACATCGVRPGTEVWVSPIYGNGRGFGLNSGNFRHGYVNDQFVMGFGIDKVEGSTRFGLMGVAGQGKLRSTGSLARTKNETDFGGVFAYANTRSGNWDMLLSIGWLGMDNDIRQTNVGGDLTGSMDSGMISLSAIMTQKYRFGGLDVMPMFGIECGYYYQDQLTVKWGRSTAFQNEKVSANMVALPVGARFARNTRLANGSMLTPEFRARYIANLGRINTDYNVSMPGSPNSALMSTRMTDRNVGDFGIGLGWTHGNLSFRGDYGYMFSKHYQDQYASVMASWRF